MKFITFILFLFLFASFSSCENHMDINDVVHGTPTKADSVMPHRFNPKKKIDSSKFAHQNVTRVYLR